MTCRYPIPCKGLSTFILGDWTPDVEGTGLYRYVVANTRTDLSATYGLVLCKAGDRPVWLNACPLCLMDLGPWLVSGQVANGTLRAHPA